MPSVGSFQLIGVTNKWRLGVYHLSSINEREFPVNRRHQQVATWEAYSSWPPADEFPVNRRHQQVATRFRLGLVHRAPSFQLIGVTNKWRPSDSYFSGIVMKYISS